MRTEHEHHVRDPNNIVPGSLFLTGRVPASLSHEGWNFSRNFRTAEVVFSRRPLTQRPTTNGNFTCPNRERSLKRSCICILCFKLSQKNSKQKPKQVCRRSPAKALTLEWLRFRFSKPPAGDLRNFPQKGRQANSTKPWQKFYQLGLVNCTTPLPPRVLACQNNRPRGGVISFRKSLLGSLSLFQDKKLLRRVA